MNNKPEINHKLNLATREESHRERVRRNEICRGKVLWECFESEVMLLLLDREREIWVKETHAAGLTLGSYTLAM